MSLILEVPEDVARAMRLPAPERKRRAELELACALYAQGVLSCGKAAQLAGLSRFQFGQKLAARNIPRHYTEENLRQDLTDDGGQ
jgi:predicted HTH domain antitoxin